MEAPEVCAKCPLGSNVQDYCNEIGQERTGPISTYIPGPECPYVQIRELEKEQVVHIEIIEDDYEKQLAAKDAELRECIELRRQAGERHALNLAAKDAEIERLREALEFYAKRNHMTSEIVEEWESVSGEPPNWLCTPSEAPYMVEDGAVARAALKEVK